MFINEIGLLLGANPVHINKGSLSGVTPRIASNFDKR